MPGAPPAELEDELLLLDEAAELDELLLDELELDELELAAAPPEPELELTAPSTVPPQPLSASPTNNPKGLIVDFIPRSLLVRVL